MASVIKPDNDELHILGSVKSTNQIDLGKLNINNSDDVDLNSLPANHAAADAALNVQGGAVVGGNLYTAGTFVAGGDVITLGGTGASLSLNANINSDVLPATTDTFDLGSSANAWSELHANKIFINDFVNSATATASVANTVDMLQTATPAAMTLANGTAGQIKMFVVETAPTNPVVVTPATPLGFASITFTNIGDSATLMYTASGWVIVATNRASVTL